MKLAFQIMKYFSQFKINITTPMVKPLYFPVTLSLPLTLLYQATNNLLHIQDLLLD